MLKILVLIIISSKKAINVKLRIIITYTIYSYVHDEKYILINSRYYELFETLHDTLRSCLNSFYWKKYL